MKCYVLNLDRSPERLTLFCESFSGNGLEIERVPAVAGETIPRETPTVSALRCRLFHGKRVHWNTVGCSLSHFAAMERFLETDNEHALICEDDVSAKPALGEVIDAGLRFRQSWDILRLNAQRPVYRAVPYADLHKGYRLARIFGWFPGAGAYLLNRRAAKKILKIAYPIYLPFDHLLARSPLYGLKSAVVDPLPVVLAPTSEETTIAIHRSDKYPALLRWPTVIPYRIVMEGATRVAQLGEIFATRIFPPTVEGGKSPL